MKNVKSLLLLSKSSYSVAQRQPVTFNASKRFLKYGALAGFLSVPVVTYLSLSDKKEKQFHLAVGGVQRFLRCAKIGTLICGDYWWNLRNVDETSSEYEEKLSSIHRRSAERMLQGCLINGGLYVKLGQGLVNLEHLLPKEYIQTLKVLQDKCLQRKEEELKLLFEEDFGKPYTEIFDSFDEKPIAAASVAQVFKAKLKDGTVVAVKVQYIDLRDRFHGDINTIDFFLKIIAWVFPQSDFRFILQELKKPLESELDFSIEGQNADKCAKNLSHLDYFHVPKVFWEQSTKRILTTEFIDGIKISETKILKEKGYSLADLDTKLFTAFAEQIFRTGFIHADPHAGNVLVRRKKGGSAELVLLDHGLYETLPDEYRISLSKLWVAIVMNNHNDMKKYSQELGVNDRYRLFCIALTHRYIPLEDSSQQDPVKEAFQKRNSSSQSSSKNVSEENEIVKIPDHMIDVYKNLPGKLLLIFRTLNTIRAIGKIHGNPVDRHKLMAHCATQYLFNQSANQTFYEKLKSSCWKLIFEIKLWFDSMKLSVLRFYFKWFWKYDLPS